MVKRRSAKARKKALSRRSWDSLTVPLQEKRQRAFEVLRKMRQGAMLTAAAKEIGIDPRTVTRHLGGALIKLTGKYRAKPTDKISRSMRIYSQGRQLAITFADSKTASTIGKYLNAVRQYLNTGDKSALKNFANIAVVDSAGISHKLETDIKKIEAIEAAKEDAEFYPIYGR